MSNYDLETLRHSTAHLMAQAIERLWPDQKVQFGVGPTIENGFYYDVDMEYHLGEEDLKKIEKKMKEIIKEKLPVERKVLGRDEAIKFFKEKGQSLKVELIQGFPEGEEISCYQQGEFIDLCRGPHVENTKDLPMSFKLLHTAGAYWKGDAKNKMLQRVYAACFETKEELKEHLQFIEEAKKRDHRKLGKELELFHFENCTPGNPFFLPKGAFVYNSLMNFVRQVLKKYDYKEVMAPLVLDVELWHTSGHYENYKENMYFTVVDEREYAIKPMNCPGHMLMFNSTRHSYRDLPLRFAEFGKVHRYEKAGAVSGLTRVRSFTQDDAHIFLREDQIQDEVRTLIEMFTTTYKHFAYNDIKIYLSTRPEEKKIGTDEMWDTAENALRAALEKSGMPYEIKEGDGAFYGPKIDFDIADALKRYHQLGTIQLDFMMPERFDLSYIDQNGDKVRPVVIHRALLGSLERFFGVYLEHVGGAFPFWLAPEQAVIVPVNNEFHLEYAEEVFSKLNKLGFRVRIDDRNESMAKKTRETQKAKIPFMLVVGDKEKEMNGVAARKYGEHNTETFELDNLIQQFEELNAKSVPEAFKN